jgi:hypothetical protein
MSGDKKDATVCAGPDGQGTYGDSVQNPTDRTARARTSEDELAALISMLAAAAFTADLSDPPVRSENSRRPADHYCVRPFFGPGSYIQY